MGSSPNQDLYPGIGDTVFNPRLAVGWLEDKQEASQDQLVKQIFQELLGGASQPKQSSGNACVKLCGFVGQCSRSPSHVLRAFAFSEETALTLFDFFVEWNEKDQHRSMRLVLDFLVSSISENAATQLGQSIKAQILHNTVSLITHQSTKPSVKSAMTALDHFLQKQTFFLDEVLVTYQEIHASSESENLDWNSFILNLFTWMELHHVWQVAGKLLVTIFTFPGHEHGPPIFQPQDWQKLLLEGVKLDLLEPIKLYVLPLLFKADRPGSLSLINDLYTKQRITLKDSDDLDANSKFWLAALEAGKKTSLVAEPSSDLPDPKAADSTIQVPADVLEDVLCHVSAETRSSAISIMIASPSSTRPYTPPVAGLLREHLPAFYSDFDTKLRYEVLGHSRNMVSRIEGVLTALHRDHAGLVKKAAKAASNAKGSATQAESESAISRCLNSLHQHQEFFRWYLRFLKYELVPTASYQRHITALKAMAFVLKSGLLQTSSAATMPLGEFILTDETWLRSILDLIMDPFDDVRENAASLIMLLGDNQETTTVRPSDGRSNDLLSELELFCKRANYLARRTARADHSDGVARAHELLCRWRPNTDAKISVAMDVLTDLEDKLVIAERDLAAAVLEAPVHGNFASLRYIWESLSKVTFSESQLSGLLSLQDRAIRCCRKIWEMVKHVLCDDSPEGHLPDELEEVEGLDTKDLLSYSFRAIHESNNFMRAVATNARLNNQQGRLIPSKAAFETIGRLCFEELSNLRHRGAFTTVTHTFASCCQLVKYFSDDAKAQGEVTLLDEWHKGSLECIYAQASTTRRSAGIPALITGILSANADYPDMANIMSELQVIARREARTTETDGSNLPQVHAMNCIKDIFKSSLLSKRAEPHLTDCLQLAADSLRSELWAIRNCGLILLRSLIDCLFGTSESKASMESGWDGKSVRISYGKFKALPSVLVNLLEISQHPTSDSSELSTAESVFPALDILRRAGPPVEFRDKLYDLVAWHLGSRFWHVREIAARTLCSFLLRPQWAESIKKLIAHSSRSTNQLHGAVLTFKFVLERLLDVMPHELFKHIPDAVDDLLDDIATETQGFDASPEVRAVCVEVIAFVNDLHEHPAKPADCSFEPQFIAPRWVFGHATEAWRVYSALLSVKTSQAGAAYDVEYLEREASGSAEDITVTMENDINAACAELESLIEKCAARKQPFGDRTAARLVEVCLAVCHATSAPKPRTLALELMATQLETLLGSKNPHSKICLPPILVLMDLWQDLQSKPVNPGLSDATIRASGPLLSAALTMNAQEDLPDNIEQWLSYWGAMMGDAGIADQGFDTRYAAAESLRAFSTHLSGIPLHPAHLPWLLALYDALNDDDEEVREVAAGATRSILGKALVSIEAATRLLRWICENHGARDEFKAHVAGRMIGYAPVTSEVGSGSSSWVSAKEQLKTAMKFDDSLFVIEEQNLYIDEVREAHRWTDAFRSLEYANDDAALRAVSSWVAAGIAFLVELAESEEDGALGWTSKPEVFAICSRILIGGAALATRDEAIKGQLEKFQQAGKKSQIHGLLLGMCAAEQ